MQNDNVKIQNVLSLRLNKESFNFNILNCNFTF